MPIITGTNATPDDSYSLINYVTKIVPDQCENRCYPWTNATINCVEQTGIMSLSYDISNGITFSGNKLGIYFCVCSEEAKIHAADCLQCISDAYCLQPPINGESYRGMCAGSTSLETLLDVTKSTC